MIMINHMLFYVTVLVSWLDFVITNFVCYVSDASTFEPVQATLPLGMCRRHTKKKTAHSKILTCFIYRSQSSNMFQFMTSALTEQKPDCELSKAFLCQCAVFFLFFFFSKFSSQRQSNAALLPPVLWQHFFSHLHPFYLDGRNFYSVLVKNKKN